MVPWSQHFGGQAALVPAKDGCARNLPNRLESNELASIRFPGKTERGTGNVELATDPEKCQAIRPIFAQFSNSFRPFSFHQPMAMAHASPWLNPNSRPMKLTRSVPWLHGRHPPQCRC